MKDSRTEDGALANWSECHPTEQLSNEQLKRIRTIQPPPHWTVPQIEKLSRYLEDAHGDAGLANLVGATRLDYPVASTYLDIAALPSGDVAGVAAIYREIVSVISPSGTRDGSIFYRHNLVVRDAIFASYERLRRMFSMAELEQTARSFPPSDRRVIEDVIKKVRGLGERRRDGTEYPTVYRRINALADRAAYINTNAKDYEADSGLNEEARVALERRTESEQRISVGDASVAGRFRAQPSFGESRSLSKVITPADRRYIPCPQLRLCLAAAARMAGNLACWVMLAFLIFGTRAELSTLRLDSALLSPRDVVVLDPHRPVVHFAYELERASGLAIAVEMPLPVPLWAAVADCLKEDPDTHRWLSAAQRQLVELTGLGLDDLAHAAAAHAALDRKSVSANVLDLLTREGQARVPLTYLTVDFSPVWRELEAHRQWLATELSRGAQPDPELQQWLARFYLGAPETGQRPHDRGIAATPSEIAELEQQLRPLLRTMRVDFETRRTLNGARRLHNLVHCALAVKVSAIAGARPVNTNSFFVLIAGKDQFFVLIVDKDTGTPATPRLVPIDAEDHKEFLIGLRLARRCAQHLDLSEDLRTDRLNPQTLDFNLVFRHFSVEGEAVTPLKWSAVVETLTGFGITAALLERAPNAMRHTRADQIAGQMTAAQASAQHGHVGVEPSILSTLSSFPLARLLKANLAYGMRLFDEH